MQRLPCRRKKKPGVIPGTSVESSQGGQEEEPLPVPPPAVSTKRRELPQGSLNTPPPPRRGPPGLCNNIDLHTSTSAQLLPLDLPVRNLSPPNLRCARIHSAVLSLASYDSRPHAISCASLLIFLSTRYLQDIQGSLHHEPPPASCGPLLSQDGSGATTQTGVRLPFLLHHKPR